MVDPVKLEMVGVQICYMPAPPYHILSSHAEELLGDLSFVEETGYSGATGCYILLKFDSPEEMEKQLVECKKEVRDILQRFPSVIPDDHFPVVYELDENNEATGVVHYFYDESERDHWLKSEDMPEIENFKFGSVDKRDIPDGTVCEWSEIELDTQ